MVEKKNLKSELEKIMTPEEMEHLKTSYDIVGDIAILEIDNELVHREKLIADTLLSLHKNIKVVTKKHGIHHGEFRTQDLVVLAGETRTETICKENNVQIKLDAEKVYFSPRLSTERKRIALQLRKEEKILAMFSGSGPYPLVMLRNEPTSYITSVEINPLGAAYQKENIVLNKSIVKKVVPAFKKDDKGYLYHEMRKRIKIYNGDVNKIVPKLPNGTIGMKSSIDRKQVDKILETKPQFMELHLLENDVEDRYAEIISTLEYLEDKDMDIVIHAPEEKFHGKDLTLLSEDKDDLSPYFMLFERLNDLMYKFHNIIGFVIHPCGTMSEKTDNDMDVFIKNIGRIKKLYPDLFGLMYFENLVVDFYSEHDIIRLANKGVNICFDLNHFFGIYKDNDKLYHVMNQIYHKTNVYFHIADSTGDIHGEPHSYEIGKGKIDFKRIAHFLDFGVIEVICKDYMNPVEAVNSYNKLHDIKGIPKFDRILMPLPKSAEDFLDTALLAAKKGTIIHFYDFLHVDDFDQAKEKIAKACDRCGVGHRIISLTKCGQHAPRVFRICVDFEVL